MSMNMNVVLECLGCVMESREPPEYLASFRHPESKVAVRMRFDTPVVPGGEYEFRVHGVFPGACENRPCSSNVLRFEADGALTAVDLHKRAMAKLDAQEKGGRP